MSDALTDFVAEPQWVAWRNEDRDGKQTKVPYVARDRRAEADDRTGWLTHDKAAALAEVIINGSGGGIGIELGKCRNVWLAGIDFDTCRDPTTGHIEPWAQEVLDQLGTYCEVSPSATGVKAFLLIDPADIDALRAIMRTQHGRQFKRANGGAHPPAIELYVSNRYFAVTWQVCDDAPNELRLVPLGDLRWLIEEAGPAFAGKSKPEGSSGSSDTILDRLNRAAARNKAVDTALRNAATMKGGSRSEGALGLGSALKRAGWSYIDMKAALLACPATREWATKAQAEGERQFERVWNKADEGGNDEAPNGEVQIVRGAIRPITTIPPRQWAYGKFLLFGSAACIGGMDGAGKGMLATAMALAMITGYPLLGEKVWRTGPVAIITYEDDQDEWERRIAAACLHYSQNGYALDYETLIGSFYFLYKPGGRVTMAERTKENGLQFPDTARIVHFLKEISAVMLIIDPFNSAHAMEDGNNNVAIAAVAQEITSIAQQAHVAALLLHHLRKGAVGNIDDLMGAVALRANFRSVRILQVATEGDALGLGIPVADAWRYLWVAGTKENYAPPPLDRLWFHKASQKLNNPAGIYELGDEVGAIGCWTPPAAFEGLDYASLRAVFDALAAGPHAEDKRAKAIPWAGQPLMELAGRNTEQATKILNQWLKSKTLVPGEPFKTEQRREIKTLVLDLAKVADILGPHAAAGNPQETAND